MIKIGSRVMYTHNNRKIERETGYYPPPGTLGTIIDSQEYRSLYRVHWDKGTSSPHIWWCKKHYVIEHKGDDTT